MRRGFLPRRNSTSAFILKGIYQALIWYVSGYKRRFGIEYLSVDLPGHSAETTLMSESSKRSHTEPTTAAQ